MKLDKKLKQIINEISELTDYNYETNNDYIEATELFVIIEDLIGIIKHQEDIIKEYKNQQNNDYVPEIEIPEIHGEGISW